MRARTIGPVLMMTLGAAIMFMPATSWVGALDVNPCEEPSVQLVGGGNNPCECPPVNWDGKVAPCFPESSTTLPPIPTLPPTTTLVPIPTLAPTTLAPTTLAPATTTAIGSGAQGLPATGSTSSGYLVLGGLLLVSGTTLLLLGRRKPAQSV